MALAATDDPQTIEAKRYLEELMNFHPAVQTAADPHALKESLAKAYFASLAKGTITNYIKAVNQLEK